MKMVAEQIHLLLIEKKKTVAVAESCTGGLLSKLLTDFPGSSRYFILGIVAYSNKAKIEILRTPSRIIAQKGAVSEEVARFMARSVRKLSGADFAIGITGIAGPTGSTFQKPTGTVFIAIDGKNNKICKKFNFKGRRISVRRKSALKAMILLKKMLSK